MRMKEMAAQYRGGAEALQRRAAELRARLRGPGLCEMDKLRLRWRIDALMSMYRDARDTAVLLEKYYDRGYRRDGRYTV
jgi:hypothetical protein